MIIKIWRYGRRSKRPARPRARQTNAFDVVYGCTSYVFGIAAPDGQRTAFEDAPIEADFALDVARAGGYIVHQDGTHEILGWAGHNLEHDEMADQVQEMAERAVGPGLTYFYHYTWSHRPGEVISAHQLREQNRTIRRVLEASDCPAIEAYHGEKKHTHGHGNLLSVDRDGVGKPLAHGWYIEALQIAIAVVERDDCLRPEPQRRYIATEEGVFDLLTGTQVADRSGIIHRSADPAKTARDGKRLPDGGLMKRVRETRAAILNDNEAPAGYEPGDEWPFERYVALVVAPRIKAAKSWDDLHRKLAPLGVQYRTRGNTGLLVAIGAGGQPTGMEASPQTAYPRAGLNKLIKRFGNQPYTPPSPDVDLRPLTMPVFNRPEARPDPDADRARDPATDIKAIRPQIAALEEHLAKRRRKARKDLEARKLGARFNEALSAQAQRDRQERELVHDFAVSKGARQAKSTSRRAQLKPSERSLWSPVRLLLWGVLRSKKERARNARSRAERERRYRACRVGGEVQYWLTTPDRSILAFTQTESLITVTHSSRQANIDALELAQERYATLRIVGTSRAVDNALKIAGELGVELEGAQQERAQAHHAAIVQRNLSGLVARSRSFHATWGTRERLRKEVQDRRTGRSAHMPGIDAHAPVMRIEPLIGAFLASGERTFSGNPDDPDVREAVRRLREDIDPNTLWLARSRTVHTFEGHVFRFLDDPALGRAFAGSPELLLDHQVQRELDKIEHQQLAQRRWIAAAIVAGNARIEDGELTVAGAESHWAPSFWRAQGADPTFRRLIAVARARPDRFPFGTTRAVRANQRDGLSKGSAPSSSEGLPTQCPKARDVQRNHSVDRESEPPRASSPREQPKGNERRPLAPPPGYDQGGWRR